MSLICQENFELPHLKESQNLKHYFGGDIQKFSSRLPGFIWSKYSGEKHLPSYNYLGPGTRLDIRLNENNIPKSGEEPINEIDRLAYIHDLAYQNSDDLNERHRADQEMINGLKQLKNLSIPQRLIRTLIIKLFQAKILAGGQLIKSEKLGQGTRAASPKEILKGELRSKRQRLSKQEAINNLYSNKIKTKHAESRSKSSEERLTPIYELNKMTKLANELHKPFRKPPQYSKVSFRSKDNIWNADLIIVSKPDAGYKYILTIMDGYTRYAWTVPLKDKKGETVANAFKDIMKKSNRKPNKLWVDQGKEFYNQHMYSLRDTNGDKLFKFKDKDILEKDENGEYKNQIYSVFNTQKNPLIERLNRTILNKLSKQQTINGNQKWLHILPIITKNYNNTIHSSIGISPAEASKDPSLIKVIPPQFDKRLHSKKPKYKEGDRVRIYKYKNKFEKGYKGYWTKEIFKISKVLTHKNPIKYEIIDLDNEPVLGRFYETELQRSWF